MFEALVRIHTESILMKKFFPKDSGNMESYATLIGGSRFYFKELSFFYF